MAKNRQLGSGDEENTRENESESDSDERTSTPNVANPEESSSSSGSGSDSDCNGSRKSRSRSIAGSTVTKAREDKERKAREQKEIKADTSVKKSNDDSKKLLFQRIWSEDDEIAILNGMTEYSSEKKTDPMANLGAFHDFIKKNLQVDVTRTQLQHKIRRLKKKYQNNKNKAKDGKDRTFSKSHEQKAYDLSKTVWGNEVGKKKGGENRVGGNGIAERKEGAKTASKRAAAAEKEGVKDRGALIVRGECENSSLGKRSSSGGLSVADRILRAGAELFQGGEGVDGQKEWKKLRMAEVELFSKQLELKLAQSSLVLDVLKSNDR